MGIDHGKDEFVTGQTHINGIEGFGGVKGGVKTYQWGGVKVHRLGS